MIRIAVLLLVLLLTPPVAAMEQCGPRAAVLSALSTKYGETRRGVGLAANGQVVEVFASAATGTWTITVTTPQGKTCLVASGQGYEAVTEAPGVDG